MEGFFTPKVEIRILSMIADESMTIGQLSQKLNFSPSSISLYVSSLHGKGLISLKTKGRSKFVDISKNEAGQDFKAFIHGNPNLSPEDLFQGHGLWILLFLTGDGSSTRDLLRETGMSRDSIIRYQRIWRKNGVIWKNGHGGRISINRNYPALEKFLLSFSKLLLSLTVRANNEDPSILFNNGKTLIFSYSGSVNIDVFDPAAYTFLSMHDHDVIASDNFFMLQLGNRELTDLEAIIQSIRIDSMNPRPRKLLLDLINSKKIDINDVHRFSVEYEISKIVFNEVIKDGRQEIFS